MEKPDLKPFYTKLYNIVKNTFVQFDEYIVYHDYLKILYGNFGGIDVETGEVFLKKISNKRKYFVEDDILKPIDANSCTLKALKHTLLSSRKRALDNLFGYALCNEWDYFLTLTFDPKKVDRDNEKAILYAWQQFRQYLQRKVCKDVKILAVPERHPTSGKLHIHALVGNIDLKSFLTKAINPHTGKVIRKNNRIVYNLDIFTFGFSTVVCVDKNEKSGQGRVVNYLSKYLVKDFGNIGYNKKNFFHTQNLNFKNKEFIKLDLKDLDIFKYNNYFCKYKETDKFTVYRVPKCMKN